MAETNQTSETPAKPKTTKKPVVTEEPKVEAEVPETEPVVEVEAQSTEANENDDFESLGKRGRKSKADIENEKKRTREDIETNYGNLIAHEPEKADLFREELMLELKQRNLL